MEGQWPLKLFLDIEDVNCCLAVQWNPAHLSPNFDLGEGPRLGLEGGCFAGKPLPPPLSKVESFITQPTVTIHLLVPLNQKAMLSNRLVHDLK